MKKDLLCKNGGKKKRAFRYLAILAGLFAIAGGYLLEENGYAAAASVRWFSYEKGVSINKKAGKKMMVHFYADWCSFCEKMERETFRDREVADYLNKEFVAVRVNSDRKTDIASDYGVQGLPSTWFVDENGRRISNLPGYVPPEQFLNILRYVHSDSYKSMSFNKFVSTM